MNTRFTLILGICLAFSTQSLSKDALRVGFLRESIEFRPVKLKNQYDNLVSQQIYQTLFTVANDGQIYSDILFGIRPSNKMRTYQLELKRGVKFSNGVELKAKHVAHSFLTHLDKKFSPVLAQYLRSLIVGAENSNGKSLPPGIKISSEYVVKLDLNFPYPDFLKLLAAPGLGIELYDEQNNRSYGSGPFQLKAIRDRRYILTRNKHFQLESKLKKIEILVKDKPKAFAQMLEVEELDFVIGYPKNESFSNLKVRYFDNNIKFYFSFNPDKSVFQSKELRQEVFHSVQQSALHCQNVEPTISYESTLISTHFLPESVQAPDLPIVVEKSKFSKLSKLKDPIVISATNLVLSKRLIRCLDDNSHKNIVVKIHSTADFNQLKYNRRFDLKRLVYRPDYLSAASLVFPFKYWLKSFDPYYRTMIKKIKNVTEKQENLRLETLFTYRDDYWIIPLFQIKVPVFHKKDLMIEKMRYIAFPNLRDFI